ncbi:alpha/beta hydrolase [bacterium]|nr:alpha/beta hydrolase [bacterium]
MKKEKILKIIIAILLILILLGVGLTEVIGNYFVNYAIARSGAGGDRKISQESTIEVLGEDEKIIENNKKIAKENSEKWSEAIQQKQVEVKANDNITLRGTEYLNQEETNKWAIILHGYRSNPSSVLTIGEHFSEKGYNVLIPSMRACADSEGEYVGMGWLDKEDLKCWINLIIEENKNAEIILHGSSMGAATVLMASGDELPANVKNIIADSGYTSVWDIFASEAKARFNLPEFPVLNMFQIVANRKAKYDIKEASSLEQVKKSKTPILFIHGDKDDFVPEYMCEKLYDATNCKKEKLIIHGAGHTDGKYREPEKYYNTIFDWISR